MARGNTGTAERQKRRLLENIKLHTEHVAKRRDVIRLTFRNGEPCSVQQREPADDCRQHKYYTASEAFCKYSIVTKIDRIFCEKTYELEIYKTFDGFFCWFFHRHFCRTKNWNLSKNIFENFFGKSIDKRENLWYNTRVKQSRALRSHLGTTVTLVNMVEIPTIVGACRAETLSLYGFFVFGGVELLARKTKRHYSTSRSPQKRFA